MKGLKRIQKVLAVILVLSMVIMTMTPSSLIVSAETNTSKTLKKVPVLAANIYNKATGENVFTPYITKDINVAGQTLKVGILGIENTDCSRFDVPDNYPGLVFAHPDNKNYSIAWEVERYVPKMKAEGCDFVIVSYHSGLGDTEGELVFGTNTENQVARMIAQTTDVDVVVAGHDHSSAYSNTYLKNKDNKDVLVVNGGGSELTKTVFQVTYDKETGFSIGVKEAGNVNLKSYKDDEQLAELIKPAVDKATEYVNQECGIIKEGNWSTSSDFYFEQTDTMDLINRAQMAIADKYLKKVGQPEVKMSSTSVVVNGDYTVQPGKMTLKDIYTMYRYDNYLYIVPLTGKEIRTWLEGNAEENFSYTIEDGKVKFGIGKNKFTNPVFYGVDFQYDLAQENGSKIVGLKFADGSEVKDNETYNVAINSYHIGQAPFTRTGKTTADAVWSSREALGDDKGTVQQMIAEFVSDCTKEEGGVSTKPSHWGLTFSKDISTLRIPVFETSDVHGTLVDTSSSKYQYRLARIADVVNDKRNENAKKERDVILLDSGDIYQGTPVSNLLSGQPMTAAYDAMGYDAVGLGNHEFDWGVTTLIDPDGTMGKYELSDTVKGDSQIPVLCNDITYKENGEKVNFTQDYKIVEKKAVSYDGKETTVKVGIIGYAEDYSSDIMAEKIAPYVINENIDTVEKQAAELKESGKAQVVVLLSHAGGPEIAGQLDKDTEVDLVLGGHTHKDGSGVAANGVPYIQPQNAGKSYGYAEICIDPDTEKVSVESQKVVNIYKDKTKFYDTPENQDNLDPEIVKISNLAIDKVKPTLNSELGYVTTPITKGLIEGSLSSVAGMWMSDLANRATGSQVSFTNAGGIRTEFLMEEGAAKRVITKGDIYTIAPFNNALYVYEENYERLKEALDYTVATAKDPGLRISGVTAYYEKDEVNTIILDGKAIYKNGEWVEDKNTPIRLCTNQYVGTLAGTPFVQWTPVETAKVDNESFMAVLEEEAKQSGGLLKVETEPNMIEGNYTEVARKDFASAAKAMSLEEAEPAEFVLMTTTDMHGKCWNQNILNDTAVNNSFLRVSSAVAEARAQYGERVILVDCGDIYQGTPVSAYNIQCGAKENPMAICLKYIGYDASVLGNHEFNYAFETMQNIYKFLQGEEEEPEVSPAPGVEPTTKPEVSPAPSVKPSKPAVMTVKVTLNANGGYFKGSKAKTVTKTVKVKSLYGTLATPVRKGYTFTGWYTGKTSGKKVTSKTVMTSTKSHSLYAHWSKVTVGKSSITSLTNTKKKNVVVKVKKVTGAKGYRIMYSRDKKFGKVKTVTTKELTKIVTGLKKGQKYYFKVQAYKTDSTGARIYSGWSAVKSKVTAK